VVDAVQLVVDVVQPMVDVVQLMVDVDYPVEVVINSREQLGVRVNLIKEPVTIME
jgi:hypothetical protein